jgi:hypothetical protein
MNPRPKPDVTVRADGETMLLDHAGGRGRDVGALLDQFRALGLLAADVTGGGG